MTSRRQFIGAVAALAATRWEAEDYDLENVEGWDPMGNASFVTGEFTPSAIGASGEGKIVDWLVGDDDLADRHFTVRYDSGGVLVTIEGEGDDVREDCYAQLPSEQAREVAAAIWQAAEELDAREEAER